jgi:hypothetical protein
MFLIENAIPFRNGVVIQGKFQVQNPKMFPGDQFLAIKNDQRVGMVRMFGILSANFTHDPSNPRYHISVGCEKGQDYRALIGATLTKL